MSFDEEKQNSDSSDGPSGSGENLFSVPHSPSVVGDDLEPVSEGFPNPAGGGVSVEPPAPASEECFFVAFGPLSQAERNAVLAVLAENKKDVSCFTCEGSGAPWKRVTEKDLAAVRDRGAPIEKTGISPLRAEDAGWQMRFGKDATVPEDMRTEDEETLKVDNLEILARAADDTLQVAARRPGGGEVDHTLRFVLESGGAAEGAECGNPHGIAPLCGEALEAKGDSSSAHDCLTTHTEDSPESGDEGIIVQQTRRFKKSTPEHTRVIETSGCDHPVTPDFTTARDPSMAADGEDCPSRDIKANSPAKVLVESRRCAAKNKDLSESLRVIGRSADDISMQVDITSTFSNGRDDTSPRITIDERIHNRMRYQVTLTLSSSSNFWTGLAQDISGGGLFVATYNILPLGTQFGVTFSLPDGKPKIHGSAEVRWLREYRDGLEVPPGMGVRFLDLSEENRQRINHFVKDRETIFFED